MIAVNTQSLRAVAKQLNEQLTANDLLPVGIPETALDGNGHGSGPVGCTDCC